MFKDFTLEEIRWREDGDENYLFQKTPHGSKLCCGLNKSDREPASCKMARTQ